MQLSQQTKNKLTRDERDALQEFEFFNLASAVAAKAVRYILAGIVVVFVLLWVGRIASPRYKVYAADIDRQVLVAEARAKADAAVEDKRAEITKAQGVAEANRIIAESISPEYVEWLYVDQLDEVDGQIIYIPTEGGIPILEAGRVSGLSGSEVTE